MKSESKTAVYQVLHIHGSSTQLCRGGNKPNAIVWARFIIRPRT